VQRDRLLRVPAFLEIVALQNPSQRVLCRQPDHPFRAERAEPLGIEADFGLLLVENLVDLALVSLGIGLHFLARQRRTGGLLARRIADQTGEIADEEDDAVPELLEVLHLPDDDGVTEVDVGSGGIEADLHRQRPPLLRRPLQLCLQVLPLDQVDRSLGEVVELLIEGERGKRGGVGHGRE
jgi:hypothetical protein